MGAPDEDVDVVTLGPSHLDSFASNIADGFEDLGLRARVVDPFATFAGQRTLRAYGRYGTVMRRVVEQSEVARANLVDRPIAQALRRLSPRLVVSVYGFFSPAQVEGWRRSNPDATWALWYPDHLSNLGPHRTLLAPYDHFFFKDPYMVEVFGSRANLPAHYLPQGCNPRFHRLPSTIGSWAESNCDVVVAGNMYVYRLLTLEALSPEFDLVIHGHMRTGLPDRFLRMTQAHSQRSVFGNEKAQAFQRARIVLNTMHYGEVTGVNSRLFEATGSGGFVLTHRNDALRRYFEPGREVAVFDTPAEMNAAIAHYLAEPDERASIAAAGAARTQREHTIPTRLLELVRVCGLHTDPPFAAIYGSR